MVGDNEQNLRDNALPLALLVLQLLGIVLRASLFSSGSVGGLVSVIAMWLASGLLVATSIGWIKKHRRYGRERILVIISVLLLLLSVILPTGTGAALTFMLWLASWISAVLFLVVGARSRHAVSHPTGAL